MSFRGDLPSLGEVKAPTIAPEEVAILFVGPPLFGSPGVYAAELQMAKGKPSAKKFPAERLEGGTWLDYNSRYSERFRTWLRLTGFGRSKYRVVVMDTTSPLAVLAVNNLPLPDSTIVMASIPGAKATPVAQNASYAALQVARRRGMHVVLALDSFLARLADFTEGKGLSTGAKAYEHVIGYLLGFISDLADATQKDARLGVGAHHYSVLLSASGTVFRSVEKALEVQLGQDSLEGSPEKVITAHALASAPAGMEGEIASSFERVVSREGGSLLDAESRFRVKQTEYGLYDVFMLYGVKEPTIFDALRAGYQAVASTAPELSLDGGLNVAPEPEPETAEEEAEETEGRARGPKQLALMEDFLMARGETVSLYLQMRADFREALLAYQAEVPAQKDPVEGLLGVYRDWMQGAFDEFASSVAEEGGPSADLEKLCAVACCVSAVQDSAYVHDAARRKGAEKTLADLGVKHPDTEGLSVVAATEALLKGAEGLFPPGPQTGA